MVCHIEYPSSRERSPHASLSDGDGKRRDQDRTSKRSSFQDSSNLVVLRQRRSQRVTRLISFSKDSLEAESSSIRASLQTPPRRRPQSLRSSLYLGNDESSLDLSAMDYRRSVDSLDLWANIAADTQTEAAGHAVADRISRCRHGDATVLSTLHAGADGNGGASPPQDPHGDSGERPSHAPRGLCDAALEAQSSFSVRAGERGGGTASASADCEGSHSAKSPRYDGRTYVWCREEGDFSRREAFSCR